VYDAGMPRPSVRALIRQGVGTSRALMSRQDKIWSRYSRDKVDIGETLAAVLRTLAKVVPLQRPLRALSVGSSTSIGAYSRGVPRSSRTRTTSSSIAA